MKVLSAIQTDGDRVALAPGGYEIVGKNVQGGGLKLQFRDQDDEVWLDSKASLSADGATEILLPPYTVAIRIQAVAAGAEVTMRPSRASVGG